MRQVQNKYSLINRISRLSILLIVAFTGSVGWGALGNPKHFVQPSAVPTYGSNNYIPTFGDGLGSVWGIEDPGVADVVSTTNLWTLGDDHTTKQEWTDLYNRRVDSFTADVDPNSVPGNASDGLISDGSAALFPPTITALEPGYITTNSNFYSYTGNYGSQIRAANYGGALGTREGGTLVLMQTSAGLNPDQRPLYAIGGPESTYQSGYDPGQIEITLHGGAPIPGGASILHWGVNFQGSDVQSSFGQVPWQELLWTIWMPEWTGDFRVNFGIVIHSAFSSARVDTAIGWMDGEASLENFVVGPPATDLDGDFNRDGTVDAADYVLWRKLYGATYTDDDYTVWQTNFGISIGPGSGASAGSSDAVPEPASLVFVLFSAAVGAGLVRRKCPGRVLS